MSSDTRAAIEVIQEQVERFLAMIHNLSTFSQVQQDLALEMHSNTVSIKNIMDATKEEMTEEDIIKIKSLFETIVDIHRYMEGLSSELEVDSHDTRGTFHDLASRIPWNINETGSIANSVSKSLDSILIAVQDTSTVLSDSNQLLDMITNEADARWSEDVEMVKKSR